MRFRLLIAVVLMTGLAAFATTVVPMSIERLTAESSNIVYARALDHSSQWNPEHTRIFTFTRFQVLRSLKGSTPSVITVKQLGGHADGYTMKVAGVRYWSNGEEAVLFLQKSPESTFAVTGLMQGNFRVARLSSGAVVVSNGVPEAKEVVGTGQVSPYRGSQLTLQELERRVNKAVAQ